MQLALSLVQGCDRSASLSRARSLSFSFFFFFAFVGTRNLSSGLSHPEDIAMRSTRLAVAQHASWRMLNDEGGGETTYFPDHGFQHINCFPVTAENSD
jgi:hypothetical protein